VQRIAFDEAEHKTPASGHAAGQSADPHPTLRVRWRFEREKRDH